jgi:DNA repair protein RecO
VPKTWTDEAIVLRTYNVGETDRFCIFLTRNMGRIAARAHGVRRVLSRRGTGLLPLHRVAVTCELHSAGYTVKSVECLNAHTSSWRDPHIFSCAHQGIELLLKLTEEGEPLPELFNLACTFLSASRSPHPPHLVPLFTLKLLHHLGSFPSITHSSISHLPFRLEDALVLSVGSGGLSLVQEDPAGLRISRGLRGMLLRVPTLDLTFLPPCPEALLLELERFVQRLIGNQLGVSLAAPAVSFAMSSGVTPI